FPSHGERQHRGSTTRRRRRRIVLCCLVAASCNIGPTRLFGFPGEKPEEVATVICNHSTSEAARDLLLDYLALGIETLQGGAPMLDAGRLRDRVVVPLLALPRPVTPVFARFDRKAESWIFHAMVNRLALRPRHDAESLVLGSLVAALLDSRVPSNQALRI